MSVGTDYGSIGGNSIPEANWVGGTLTLKNYQGTMITDIYDNTKGYDIDFLLLKESDKIQEA